MPTAADATQDMGIGTCGGEFTGELDRSKSGVNGTQASHVGDALVQGIRANTGADGHVERGGSGTRVLTPWPLEQAAIHVHHAPEAVRILCTVREAPCTRRQGSHAVHTYTQAKERQVTHSMTVRGQTQSGAAASPPGSYPRIEAAVSASPRVDPWDKPHLDAASHTLAMNKWKGLATLGAPSWLRMQPASRMALGTNALK